MLLKDLAVAPSNKNNNYNKKMEILRCTIEFNKMLKVTLNVCFMFQEFLGQLNSIKKCFRQIFVTFKSHYGNVILIHVVHSIRGVG